MSVISNIHTATVYDAKQSKPFEGQRLVVTIAKKDAQGNYGPHLQQTQCTSIPLLTAQDIDFTNMTVQNLCVSYFHKVQNEIISCRIKEGQKSVTTDDLGQDAIVLHLMSESSGDKWDSARVAAWFTESLALPITEALMLKGFSDEKIDSSMKAYEKLLSDCLGSRAVIPRKKAEAIQKALALGDSKDVMIAKFSARIAKVLEESALDEMLGL